MILMEFNRISQQFNQPFNQSDIFSSACLMLSAHRWHHLHSSSCSSRSSYAISSSFNIVAIFIIVMLWHSCFMCSCLTRDFFYLWLRYLLCQIDIKLWTCPFYLTTIEILKASVLPTIIPPMRPLHSKHFMDLIWSLPLYYLYLTDQWYAKVILIKHYKM
jgi:hypothetical protein